MPTWWGKYSSKNAKKKTSTESVVCPPEHKGIMRSDWPRRYYTDKVSERGSPTEALHQSPCTNVPGSHSSFDRPQAHPLPLPSFQTSRISYGPPEISISRPMLEKNEKHPLQLPLPNPGGFPVRPEAALGGDLGTALNSGICSAKSNVRAGSQLLSPHGNEFEVFGKPLGTDYVSSLRHLYHTPYPAHMNSKDPVKPGKLYNNKYGMPISKKHGDLNSSQGFVQSSWQCTSQNPLDGSMASPSRSPMKALSPEEMSSSFLWVPKPSSDVSFVGSRQCSSSGSGQTSGHNSAGGDTSGQLFWQHCRGSSECSPIMSPRMASPGPSSRTGSGTVTPSHSFIRGTGPELQKAQANDSRKEAHVLPLPPITVSEASPYLLSPSTFNKTSQISCAAGRSDSTACMGSRWKKGKLIGRGTFGHVYVGFNSESGDMCAMKEVTLFTDDAKSKESVEQLRQEVSLLSVLEHPNIVRYYGTETIDDKLYIYLEYVSGGSIHKLLQEYGSLGEPAIRSYTHQILSGLSYLHGKNTVHRDIKGGNILVDPTGCVKLADFGVAKHITGQSSLLSLKGSPFWMAPEVIKKTNGSHLLVDIWSLGCTVLEMATGKPPWSQYEGIAALFKIGNSKELPVIPDFLSDDGKDFVRWCLQRDPSKRPTAAELLQHPFVKIVTSVERPLRLPGVIPGTESSESIGILTGKHLKGANQTLSFSNMDTLKTQKLREKHDTNISYASCLISPTGSPLLQSRSPIGGRMSPSQLASPRTTFIDSTPHGGASFIPYGHTNQLNYLDVDYGNKSRSPRRLHMNGSSHVSLNDGPYLRDRN